MTRFAAFTTKRRQGDARAVGALPRLLKTRGWPEAVATAEQVHGTRVLTVPRLRKPEKYAGADGLLTDQASQPLAIFTADCASIFLADKKGRAVGVLHAGWRGVRGGILRQALRLLRRRWRIPPGDLRAWLGPCIGPCCFEVQWEVARYFPATRRRKEDRWQVDLAEEIRRQARRLGLQFLRRKAPASCTMHDRRFYSYRRDRSDQRMASVIMRTE